MEGESDRSSRSRGGLTLTLIESISSPSGLFAVQMAHRHPNAEVIGIDLIPTLTLTERRSVSFALRLRINPRL